jgi:hypothetical protein
VGYCRAGDGVNVGADSSDVESDLRPLNNAERAILARLLEGIFPGREPLLTQSLGITGRRIDTNGSLALHPGGPSPKADVVRRVPVEAEFEDGDGVIVHVLLHVLDGYLNELEIFREDSAAVQHVAPPTDFRLVVL